MNKKFKFRYFLIVIVSITTILALNFSIDIFEYIGYIPSFIYTYYYEIISDFIVYSLIVPLILIALFLNLSPFENNSKLLKRIKFSVKALEILFIMNLLVLSINFLPKIKFEYLSVSIKISTIYILTNILYVNFGGIFHKK